MFCEGPAGSPHAHRRPLVSFNAVTMTEDELGSMALGVGEPILAGVNLAAGQAEWMLERPKPTQSEHTRAAQRMTELPGEFSSQARMILAGPRARQRERNNQGIVHLSAAGEPIALHLGQRVPMRAADAFQPPTPAQPGDYCRVWFRCPICHDRLSARGYKLSVVLDGLAISGIDSISLPDLRRYLRA